VHRWWFLFSGSEGSSGVNEIMISKKWVAAILVIIGLGAGVVWGVPKVLELSQAEEPA
jgi:hypothetical protein